MSKIQGNIHKTEYSIYMNKQELKQALETIFFVATRPLTTKQLTTIIGECEKKMITDIISELNQSFKKTSRVFRFESIADGFQMHTLPEHKKWAQALETVRTIKLSPAVMETLAIIAYKQPITRSGIEFIRGVDSSHTIRRLMQQKLVRIVGREMLPGRPGIYGTTKNFLEIFGITNLKYLPTLKELDMEILPEENQLELPIESDSD